MKIKIPKNLYFIKSHFSSQCIHLVKLGGFKDGSYVADYFSLIQTKLLVSGGVGSNVRFESDFYDINQHLNIILIDPTVSVTKMFIRGFYHFLLKEQSGFRSLSETLNYLFLRRKAKLLKKYLGNSFLIKDVLATMGIQPSEKSVFIKLDIEGAEYDLLQSIIDVKEKLTGVCIEFHELHFSMNRDRLASFLTAMKFKIVHVSVNEICLTEGNYPSVLEISMIPDEQVNSLYKQSDIDELYLQSSNAIGHELVYLSI